MINNYPTDRDEQAFREAMEEMVREEQMLATRWRRRWLMGIASIIVAAFCVGFCLGTFV